MTLFQLQWLYSVKNLRRW